MSKPETQVQRDIRYGEAIAKSFDGGKFPEDSEPQAVAYTIRQLIKHIKEQK